MSNKIQWHVLFAALLQELLGPVQIDVQTNVEVSSQPPEIDIVILQRLTETWTEEQRRYLPDGIRDSYARHILLEFKYSESVNRDVIDKVLGYEVFYRQPRKLSRAEAQSFIISSKTPRQEILNILGYQPTGYPGVYRSDNVLLEDKLLLVLNELSDAPHNVFFKLFASRRQARSEAVQGIQRWWAVKLSRKLFWLVRGLLKLLLAKGEQLMEAITPEMLIEEGKLLGEFLIPFMPEDQLAELLQDNPFLQRVRAESVIEGREEGREEGQQVLIKSIARALAIRFEVEMDVWLEKFAPLSLPILDTLSEAALTAVSLSEFEQRFIELTNRGTD